MKKHFLIALCFVSTLAWGQVRPGTGGKDTTAKDLGDAISKEVSENTKGCGKAPQKFKNIVEIQTYISMKNVAADGKKDCSELEPTVTLEVSCLFKGFAGQYLSQMMRLDQEVIEKYFKEDLKLDEKESKLVGNFYNEMDKTLNPRKNRDVIDSE